MKQATVSIIIPVRNEAEYIGTCLQHIFNQTYPHILEVICIDGDSTDATRTVIEQFNTTHFSIHLLDNPAGIVPPAMNIGIRAAIGDIIVRIDSRTYISPDYVENIVEILESGIAVGAGGPQRTQGINYISKAISLAMNSRFGMGAAHRVTSKGMYADTIYLGAYHRDTIRKAGYFDERFIRNQDYEFNYRVRKYVGDLYCSPDVKSLYIGRSSLSGLCKQFFQYGYWKTRTLWKHPESLKVRQLVAPSFVLSLLILLGASFATSWALYGFLTLISLYLAANVIFVILEARKTENRNIHTKFFAFLPIIYMIMHFSWGTGFSVGAITLARSSSLRKSFRELQPPQNITPVNTKTLASADTQRIHSDGFFNQADFRGVAD